MTADLVPTSVSNPDQERWDATLRLVGEWLMEHSGNTRTAYADSIGWPYRPDGTWRGYHTPRKGVTWLNWCHHAGVHLFAAKRLHVLAWIEQFPTVNLAKRSRIQLVSTTSSFYKWAMQDGHTESNPVALINRRKKQLQVSRDPSPTRSLSAEETQALIAAADRDPVQAVRLRTSAIIALLFMVGPRVGEICNATLSDMRVQDGRRVLLREVKGGKRHLFALPPEVCTRIDAYLDGRDDLNRLPVRRGADLASVTPLFATKTGRPFNRREVLTLVKRVARLAGLDDPDGIHPHVARHTFITEARRLGYAGDEIQRAVGHADLAQTDKYGTHILNLKKSPAYGVAAQFAPEERDKDRRWDGDNHGDDEAVGRTGCRHGQRVATPAAAQGGKLVATVDIPNDGVFLGYYNEVGALVRIRPINRVLEVGDTVTFRLENPKDVDELLDLDPAALTSLIHIDIP
jgi:integrase/recombinase XerD